MRLVDPILMELEQEGKSTRRILERVPEDKLSWKPHEKSMSLGILALHVAMSQGYIAEFTKADSFEPSPFSPPEPKSRAEILSAFDQSLAKAKEIVGQTDDARAMADWSFLQNGKPRITMPRIGVFRFVMMNHLYHHRGQLSVYLRLLDVPLPSIYGPSADENPFA